MTMTAGSFEQIDGVAWADPGRATSICSPFQKHRRQRVAISLYLFLCLRADAICRPGAPSTNAQLGFETTHQCCVAVIVQSRWENYK